LFFYMHQQRFHAITRIFVFVLVFVLVFV